MFNWDTPFHSSSWPSPAFPVIFLCMDGFTTVFSTQLCMKLWPSGISMISMMGISQADVMCSWMSDLPCDPAEGTPPWHSPGCKERNEIFAQLHVFWQCEGVRVHCTECNGGCPCREPLYCKSALGGIWSPGFSLLLCKDIIIYIYICFLRFGNCVCLLCLMTGFSIATFLINFAPNFEVLKHC